MKIVLICGAGMVSGKEIMSLALMRELQRRGHKCSCITSSWGSALFRSRLKEIGVPYHTLRIGFISKTWEWKAMKTNLIQLAYMPGLYFSFLRLMRKEKPDLVIHTNFHHAFLLSPVIFWRSYYWSHEIIPDSKFYRRLFRLLSRRMELFIAVSQAAGNSLVNILSSGKVVVVRNGIADPAGDRNEFKSTGTIAIVGQVSADKGHGLLISALRTIIDAVPDVRLNIVGTGDPRFIATIKKRISDLEIERNLNWVGYVEDKASMYEGMDAVVVPSIFPDPYPTVVMESSFFGVPVVAADIGGIPEMVVEGVNGFLFRASDEDSLAKVLTRFLTKVDRQALGESSRKFALTNFALDRFVDQFEALLLNNRA
jgi:glycosyltransferase involved in cell wall biosynthesis